MRVIILAAGKGERLRPLTDNKPKCLVSIKNKPLIEYQLKIFDSLGIKSITLVGGYLYEKLKYLSREIIVNKEYYRTNMLYSLFCSIDMIKDDVLICYGDSIFSKETLKSVLNCSDSICVPSDLNWKKFWKSRYKDPLLDLETFIVDKNNYIKSLGDKPKSYNEIQGQYIGLIKLNAQGSLIFNNELHNTKKENFVNEKRFDDAYLTDFLSHLIFKGYKIKSHGISSEYIEIDTIDDIKSKITNKRIENFNF